MESLVEVERPRGHRVELNGVELPAAGTGVTDFNCSSDVTTRRQRTGSFFVSMAAESSE
jgi:hypothetical protein